MFVVLANATIALHPEGGDHWMRFPQYPLGLKALSYRVFWLEILPSMGDATRATLQMTTFFAHIDGDYPRHSRAAREIAEAHFDSRHRCIEAMIGALQLQMLTQVNQRYWRKS